MSSIKDVAKHAGVGLGTVSRVINNSGYVSEETRKKVERAVRELNYVPNEIARNFKAQSSKIVALILPTIHHPFFSEFAFHMEKHLNDLGYKLMLCNSNFEVEKEKAFIELLNKNIIDGLIFISNSDIDEYITPDMLVVAIDRHFTHERAFIASDNFGGGRLAAEKLLAAGCKKPAYIGGFPPVNTEVLQRKDGFLSVMQAEQVEYVVYEEPHTLHNEAAFVKGFAAGHPDVDGVFAITDMLAHLLLAHYQDIGRRVPHDVQVIGFDGIRYFQTQPRNLSTIRQPVEQLGELAAERIVTIIEGGVPPKRTILPVSFLQGQTTR